MRGRYDRLPRMFLHRWLVPFLVAAVAAFAFLPAIGAGITPEDWGWLALTRHLDDPSVVLRENAFFTYFYRPVGLAFWWITAQAFGADGTWHYVANLALHAANAALVAIYAHAIYTNRLERAEEFAGDALAPRWLAGAIAGLVFAAAPAGVGTAIWLSDRFDPLALFFGLAALIAGERTLHGRRLRDALVMTACLVLALLSKEVAYAVAGALLVRALAQRCIDGAFGTRLAIAAVAAVIVALGLRLASGTALTASGTQVGVGVAIDGVVAWWRYLPFALSGFRSAQLGMPATLLVIVTATLFAIAATLALRRRDAYALRTLPVAVALIVAPSLLQVPIVHLALAGDAGVVPMNLRFYYLATAGIALAAPVVWFALRGRVARMVVAVVMVATVGASLVASRDVAARWTASYAADSARVTRLATELVARDFVLDSGRGCRIELAMPDYSDDVRTHIDTMVKGVAPRGASVLGCAVFAGRPVYNTVVDGALCAADAWPGLRIAVANGQDLADRFGNLCTLQFVEPDHAQTGPGIFHYAVDARGAVSDHEVPSQ